MYLNLFRVFILHNNIMLKLCKSCTTYFETDETYCKKCNNELKEIHLPVKLTINKRPLLLSLLALLGWGLIPLLVYGYKSKSKLSISIGWTTIITMILYIVLSGFTEYGLVMVLCGLSGFSYLITELISFIAPLALRREYNIRMTIIDLVDTCGINISSLENNKKFHIDDFKDTDYIGDWINCSKKLYGNKGIAVLYEIREPEAKEKTKQFLNKIQENKDRLEKERLENERLEKEKIQKNILVGKLIKAIQVEMKRQEEVLEKERLKKERIEKELLERERLKKEQLEKERIRKEKLVKKQQELEQNIINLIFDIKPDIKEGESETERKERIKKEFQEEVQHILNHDPEYDEQDKTPLYLKSNNLYEQYFKQSEFIDFDTNNPTEYSFDLLGESIVFHKKTLPYVLLHKRFTRFAHNETNKFLNYCQKNVTKYSDLEKALREFKKSLDITESFIVKISKEFNLGLNEINAHYNYLAVTDNSGILERIFEPLVELDEIASKTRIKFDAYKMKMIIKVLSDGLFACCCMGMEAVGDLFPICTNVYFSNESAFDYYLEIKDSYKLKSIKDIENLDNDIKRKMIFILIECMKDNPFNMDIHRDLARLLKYTSGINTESNKKLLKSVSTFFGFGMFNFFNFNDDDVKSSQYWFSDYHF